MLNNDLPILVSGAQMSIHVDSYKSAPTPLDMLEQMASEACLEAGTGVLESVDTIFSLPPLNWREANPAAAVADRLKIDPRRTVICEMGGEIGVKAVNWLAEEILDGRVGTALIVTSENLRTADLATREGTEPDWPADGGYEKPEFVFGHSPMHSHDEEIDAGMIAPIIQYPEIENAMRAAKGLGLEEHRQLLGRLFAPFTEVAAKNPYAWFPVARSAEELITVTPQNRMVGFPYTKYLNAILSIDQASALVMTSVGEARRLGIDEDRWIYWWGGGAATEAAYHVCTRRHLDRSFALVESHTTTLKNAEVAADDLARFDLYSCFPAPVQAACEVLGIAHDDPRGLTVTGGLPYAGGPGSGYTIHSLATMCNLLRQHSDEVGMVTGNGMSLTKHSATILSHQPPKAERPTAARLAARRPTDLPEAQPIALERREASGTVDSYTVMHGRDGAPAMGGVIGSYDDGVRFVARLTLDAEGLAAYETEEQVGTVGDVHEKDGKLLFDPA
jgi:acetyl-CoA C-acetyltransferase